MSDADATPEELDPEFERWESLLMHVHAELGKPGTNKDPRLILTNENLGAAIHITKKHDLVLEKLCTLVLSLQERAYLDRKVQAEKIRDLQLKVTDLKKLSSTAKKAQDSLTTRIFLEKMVSIEEDKNDVNWLRGSLKIARLELQRKGQRLELQYADFDKENEEIKAAKEYCKQAVNVVSEAEEFEQGRKDLRRMYNLVDKKKGRTEYSESHKEIFSFIESLDLLSDAPINFRENTEDAKKPVETDKPKETPAKATSKPQNPAQAEYEHMENLSKKLELSSNLLQQQHQQAVGALEGDFARSVNEVKEKYEGYKKKYEEEMAKGRDKDREIAELKTVRENVIKKLVKANKRAKRIEGMVFLNENIKNIYNSIEYKDGVVAALDLRYRMSEQVRIMDKQKMLMWARDMQLEYLDKYDRHNGSKREEIMLDYQQKLQEIHPLEQQLISHQAQMNEYRRNENWLNQTRKCFEINEDHLKKFIVEVPRNVDRLVKGRVEPDSLEAQLLDVKAWAKECLRFKQLADTLLAQRKKMDGEFTTAASANKILASELANMNYRQRLTEKVVETNIKRMELQNTRIIQWLFLSVIRGDPVLDQLMTGAVNQGEGETQENGGRKMVTVTASTSTEDPDVAPEPVYKTATGEKPMFTHNNFMAQLRAYYYHYQSSLLGLIVTEAQNMRERAKEGLPMCDDSRLAGIAVALDEFRHANTEVSKKIFEDMTLRSHWSYFVNPKAAEWKLNETVEKEMIKEMQERIYALEADLVEMRKKVVEMEKEVAEKTNHVRIVEGVYLRCRYGTERVQESPRIRTSTLT